VGRRRSRTGRRSVFPTSAVSIVRASICGGSFGRKGGVATRAERQYPTLSERKDTVEARLATKSTSQTRTEATPRHSSLDHDSKVSALSHHGEHLYDPQEDVSHLLLGHGLPISKNCKLGVFSNEAELKDGLKIRHREVGCYCRQR
jgi:hypothetical protein